MKQLTVWQCEHCKQLFRTPNRHDCKKDPEKKNCFSCKWLDGWTRPENAPYTPYHECDQPTPICKNPDVCRSVCMEEWDLEEIKRIKYNMQCKGYCKGEYYKDVYKDDNPF